MQENVMSDEIEKLAEAITKDLFTSGDGKVASRLVHEEFGRRSAMIGNCGGWCKEAISGRIENAIRDAVTDGRIG